MDRQGFFWKMQRGELPPPNIGKTLGIQFNKIDPEQGTLEASFTIGEEFTNPAGNVQGGILAAILDDTMGPALAAMLEENQFAPTLNLNVSFIKPAKPGKFIGKGKVVKKGATVCYLQGELFNEKNELLATATATAKIASL
ncbi:MAG: PaaI family thioesterase [Cellvibrionaceae bacterium]